MEGISLCGQKRKVGYKGPHFEDFSPFLRSSQKSKFFERIKKIFGKYYSNFRKILSNFRNIKEEKLNNSRQYFVDIPQKFSGTSKKC